ncbi:MAG: hypothetical protein ABI466_07055 [Chloroflexota bacterium]
MTAKAGRTTEVPRREARVLVAKAREFLAAAQAAAENDHHDAALLNAVHAGIAASDAVCVALLGRRSSDPDHQRAVDLLENVAELEPEARIRARQLRSLIAKKNFVAYEARRATAAEARDGLARAIRFLAWTDEALLRAKV